ncbi:MAG: SIS domain-containing protein [Streptosporangiaceae bacterium]
MTRLSNLEQEIREQPDVLTRRRRDGQAAAAAAARLLTRPDVTHLVIAARGSSDNAARYAQYLFGQILRLPAYLAAPALFARPRVPVLAGAAVLGISQSGQSPDVVSVLTAAQEQERPVIAITNDAGSPLAANADVTVPLLTGPERSVAATKTYTATLMALAQLCAAAGGSGEIQAGLDRLPDLMAQILDVALAADEPAAGLGDSRSAGRFLTAVGRGTGLSAAAETALKIREIAGIRTEAFSLPDLMHGPVAANSAGSSLWVVASPSYPASYWERPVALLRSRGVSVTAVVPAAESGISADVLHRVPGEHSAWLFDLVAVAYGQVAALRLGERYGTNVDAPAGLSKVTLTR